MPTPTSSHDEINPFAVSMMAPAERSALYNRIKAFVIDEPDTPYPFTERLARENGWARDYAERVVEEYRRFLLLAVAAAHPVTPSDQVDQAWHLHLTYTRSYWEDFCPQVLGQPLHHQPTRGGSEEQARFCHDYARTLESYYEFFEERPPSDIWPEPPKRFPRAPSTRMSFREVAVVTLCIVAYLALSVGARCLARWIDGPPPPPPPPPEPRPLSPEDVAILRWFGIGFAATFLVAGILRWFWRQPSGEPEPEALDLDPYEAAHLAGGHAAARCAAVAALVGDGLLTVASPAGTLQRHPQAADVSSRHVMEQAVWRAVDAEQGVSLEALHENAGVPVGLDERLQAANLVLGEEMATIGHVLPLAFALLAPFFGVARMLGMPDCEPTGVLIFPCLLATGLSFLIFGRRLHRTRRGDRALAALKTRHADLKDKFSKADATVLSDELARGVGLFGIGILAGGPLKDLHALMKPHIRDDGPIWVWHENSPEAGDTDGCEGCGGGCGCG